MCGAASVYAARLSQEFASVSEKMSLRAATMDIMPMDLFRDALTHLAPTGSRPCCCRRNCNNVMGLVITCLDSLRSFFSFLLNSFLNSFLDSFLNSFPSSLPYFSLSTPKDDAGPLVIPMRKRLQVTWRRCKSRTSRPLSLTRYRTCNVWAQLPRHKCHHQEHMHWLISTLTLGKTRASLGTA